MTKEKTKWVRANRERPCLICAKADYCTISADGQVAHCMRVESGKAVASGGWMHRVSDPVPMPVPKAPTKLDAADVTAMAAKMYRGKLAPEMRERLAEKLGVSANALSFMLVGIGWDYDGTEFASFPSRGDDGKVIGITRRYMDGAKKTMAGTKNGVFFGRVSLSPGETLLIVEGASDVAALTMHGLPSLGRPSNVGGVEIIKAMMNGKPELRRAIVVGENDDKAALCRFGCSGCAKCWPGRYGASRVAFQLKCAWRMVPRPYKDVRDWANKDANFRDSVLKWLEPKGPPK
jgi:hypothetical protein